MQKRALVILGTDERAELPSSDRGAVGLAVSELGGHVIACARADGPDASRYAAAAGVEQFVEPDGLEDCEFDVALVGRGGCGDAGDLLPAMLAERSGAALVCEVVDVRQRTEGLEVTRDLGRGARDVLLVRGRAVLVIADSVRRVDYVSRRRRLAASVPETKASSPSGRAAPITWQHTVPRVRLGDHAARVQGSATRRMHDLLGVAVSGDKDSDDAHVVTGSPETCARHLLRYLVHHDFIALDIDETREAATETVAKTEPPAAIPRSIRQQRGPRRATGTEQGIARRPLPLESVSTKIEGRAPRPVSGGRTARRRPQRITEQGPKP